MKNIPFVSIFIFVLAYFQSCNDQYDFSTDKLSTNVEINPDLAIPLVNASVSVDDFLSLNDTVSYLRIDPDNFMTLIYDCNVESFPAVDYFDGTYSGILDSIYYDVPAHDYELQMDRLQSYGEFYIANPQVTLSIKNYWNVPIQFKFLNFNYHLTETSPGLPVTGSFTNDWHSVNRPVSPEIFAITEYVMNSTNSNVDDVISAMPHHFRFGAVMATNPGVGYSVSPATADSAGVKIEIPLDLRITNLVLTDTFAINIGNNIGSDTSKFESVQLNIIFENGFPLDMDAQIYFTDENYVKLDSISTEPISIESGVVTNGKITQSVKSFIDPPILLEGEKKATFFNSSYIVAKLTFNTVGNSSGQTVKFYSDYHVGLKIGAIIKLKL
jgi:hypothetical protein